VTLLLQLFGVFAVLSLLGFGGGNAIIPQMHQEVVERYHWLTSAQFTQYYAIGRLAPAPTSMVCALVGYQVAGFAGAAVATFALFVPGSIVVTVAGKAWKRLGDSPVRLAMSSGLGPVVVGLAWASVVTIGQGAVDSVPTVAIAVAATALMLWVDLSVPVTILLGAAAGVVLLR
jgi:chromate transporter